MMGHIPLAYGAPTQFLQYPIGHWNTQTATGQSLLYALNSMD